MNGTAQSLAETSARRHPRPASEPFRVQAPDPATRFDYLLPSGQVWFKVREVARIAGLCESTIDTLFEEGRLISGHVHSCGSGQRVTKRIPRSFVISFLIRTARYDQATKLQAFLACLREFNADELRQIATAANCRANRQSGLRAEQRDVP